MLQDVGHSKNLHWFHNKITKRRFPVRKVFRLLVGLFHWIFFQHFHGG